MSNNKQNRNEIIVKTGASLLQSAKEGLGLGIGVGLAQRAMTAIFGPPVIQITKEKETRAPTEYEQCLIDKRDLDACAHLLKKE
jgi:hypothetical protein